MKCNLPRLIGITGRAGAGKDTLADYLVNRFDYRKYSLSTTLKKLIADRFGYRVEMLDDRTFKEMPREQFGYHASPDFSSELFSPRSWMQWLGTEVGRHIGGEDVWVNMMEREWRGLNAYMRLVPPRMVVPDVRFDNEARRIHLLGGVVLRVVRDDVVAVAKHVSEAGVSDELVNVQVVNRSDILTFLRESVYALEICPRGEARDSGPLESGDL